MFKTKSSQRKFPPIQHVMCDPRSTPNNALRLRRLRIILRIGAGPAADPHRKPVTKVSPTLRHGQRFPVWRRRHRDALSGRCARREPPAGCAPAAALPHAERPAPAQSRAPRARGCRCPGSLPHRRRARLPRPAPPSAPAAAVAPGAAASPDARDF